MGLAGGPRRTAPPPGSSTDSFKKQAKRKEVLRGGVRASAHLLPRGGGVGGTPLRAQRASASPFFVPGARLFIRALSLAVWPVVRCFLNPA